MSVYIRSGRYEGEIGYFEGKKNGMAIISLPTGEVVAVEPSEIAPIYKRQVEIPEMDLCEEMGVA